MAVESLNGFVTVPTQQTKVKIKRVLGLFFCPFLYNQFALVWAETHFHWHGAITFQWKHAVVY